MGILVGGKVGLISPKYKLLHPEQKLSIEACFLFPQTTVENCGLLNISGVVQLDSHVSKGVKAGVNCRHQRCSREAATLPPLFRRATEGF